MDEEQARRLLGVGADATSREIRTAYRAAVRRVHPDLSAAAGSSAAIARLSDAYKLLRDAGSIVDTPPVETIVEPDGLTMVAPRDEVFDRLLAACDQIGSVTACDADDGYIEAVIDGSPGLSACQLVVSLQGRAHGVEAFFTLEPLDPRLPTPRLPDLVQRIAQLVNEPT